MEMFFMRLKRSGLLRWGGVCGRNSLKPEWGKDSPLNDLGGNQSGNSYWGGGRVERGSNGEGKRWESQRGGINGFFTSTGAPSPVKTCSSEGEVALKFQVRLVKSGDESLIHGVILW